MLSKNLVKLSAAGSGKTWGICNDALSIVKDESNKKKVLITTYTNKGIECINKEIKKLNFGVISECIIVRSWHQFLLNFLIKPYQTFITEINSIRSYDFSHMYGKINYSPFGNKLRYITPNGNVLVNHASELAVFLNKKSNGMVIKRLEKIFSHIFIDEIQDMAGYDLDLIELLMDSNIKVVCVGDNKQATFKTHNTCKRKQQSGKNIWRFFEDLESKGKVEIEFNLVSRRFNNSICQFANFVYPNNNDISTILEEKTEHDGVFLILRDDVHEYYDYFKPVVLKYDIKTSTSDYPSFNFGQCKGMTFDRVLIYPNKSFIEFLNGKSFSSPHKYYVAVTRPKYSLAIVMDRFPNNLLFRDEIISLGKIKIVAKRFIN